jgi:hypothetical protein
MFDVVEMETIEPGIFDGQRPRLDGFTRFNDHLAKRPTNGGLIDLVHRLEMMLLVLAFQ